MQRRQLGRPRAATGLVSSIRPSWMSSTFKLGAGLLVEAAQRLAPQARPAAAPPAMLKFSPRRAMLTSSADSICLRFSSSTPHRLANRWLSTGVKETSTGFKRLASATTSPRSECGSAAVIVTSTNCPIRRGAPRKVDHAVVLACGRTARRDPFSTGLPPGCAAACRPCASLMARACASSRSCSRCRRASLISCGVSSGRLAAGVPGRRL